MILGSNSNNSEKGVEVRTYDIPNADAMAEFMKEHWAHLPLNGITAYLSITHTKLRRNMLTKSIYFKFRINARPKPR
jgi:Xaa-Pro aminopeptidase